MPFAIVDGEPVTELPRDLYIPPQALEVFLEAFEGPLDLLLYLIRRQNLNILDIPIAEITRQYMEYIELMQELELELAGEYLLMAAMLAEIKSRMLLPRASEGGEEEEDPRAELVRRLQEYERFKQAAEDIDRAAAPRARRLARGCGAHGPAGRAHAAGGRAAGDAGRVQGRACSAPRCLRTTTCSARRCRCASACPMCSRCSRASGWSSSSACSSPRRGGMGVTVTFVAILELLREQLVEIVQAEPYQPLHVRRVDREPDADRGRRRPGIRRLDGSEPMETGQLKGIIEAALLAYGQPLSIEQLREIFEEFERPDAATGPQGARRARGRLRGRVPWSSSKWRAASASRCASDFSDATVAALAGAPDPLLARAARDARADRLPPADHARRDRGRARRDRQSRTSSAR